MNCSLNLKISCFPTVLSNWKLNDRTWLIIVGKIPNNWAFLKSTTHRLLISHPALSGVQLHWARLIGSTWILKTDFASLSISEIQSLLSSTSYSLLKGPTTTFGRRTILVMLSVCITRYFMMIKRIFSWKLWRKFFQVFNFCLHLDPRPRMDTNSRL